MSALESLLIAPQQRRHMEEACAQYERHVNEAADYLSARGITEEAAHKFRFGVVRGGQGEHERFEGMLSIPYLSQGGVLAFKMRCMGRHNCKAEGHPKYTGPSGQKARLYNVNALLSRTSTIALVEGEMAAAVFETQVGIPTVATPGTEWVKEKPHWPRVFADFERVFVVADHDLLDGKTDPGKGVGHAKRVVSTLQGAELILPPPGMDPDEWVLAEGVDVVRKAMGL